MNIIFALYNKLASNSGFHVRSLAQELLKFGHNCVIATPEGGDRTDAGSPLRVMGYDAVSAAAADRSLFSGAEIDAFHAWTPRTVVTRFHASVQEFVKGGTFVHLEDNEDELARAFLGERMFAKTLAGGGPDPFPAKLTHPLHGQAFIARARGVTVIMDALAEKVPHDIPTCCIWPAADDKIFYPRPKPEALRKKLGISPGTCILVYTGNGHPANFRELRSLYLAVHLLNRAGTPAKLIRTGQDYFRCPAGYKEWSEEHSINLGFVKDRAELGELLALADVCVQPGSPGQFNDYRFPSKLPEFFASGRPVILPRTNIGHHIRHLEEGYLLDVADGVAICDAVLEIMADKQLEKRLSTGARAFYDNNLTWEKSARKLNEFYGQA